MASSSTTSSQTRCKICNNLDYRGHSETDLQKQELKLAFAFPDLDRDCPLCRLVILSLESVVDKDCWNARVINPENGKEALTAVSLTLVKDRPIRGYVSFHHNKPSHTRQHEDGQNRGGSLENGEGMLNVRFLVYSGDELCPILPSLPTIPPFRKDVTLEYAVSLVRRSQIRCSENHEGSPCSVRPSGFVPTRLISINPEAAPLRLVESSAVTGRYATLSYCWGGAKPLSTTKANHSARLHNIPEDSLPVVFRQAIQLARMLEIPYIWIDSLCIIQDSVEDWEAESQRMSLYYKNGSINIATGTSDNPDTPFIKHIHDKWCPTSVKVHDSQGRPSIINTKCLPSLIGSNREVGAMFTRAWTFQESLFAPRTINFTLQGVVWSCWGDILSDHYPDPYIVGTLNPGIFSKTIVGESKKAELDAWRLLVFLYSSRLLTFPMDKLPAISGAAAQFYESLHCPYLAGHWYDDLPQSLAWYFPDGLDPPHVPREYVAPSWSWASVTKAISLGTGTNGMLSPAAKLLDVHCDVPGKNPYGKVSSGFIDLRGKTVPVVVTLGRHYVTKTPEWSFLADSTLKKSGDSLSRAKIGDAISEFDANACCLYLTSLTESGKSNKLAARPFVTHCALVLGWPDREQTSFIRVGLLMSTSERAMDLFDGAVEKTVRII